MVKTRLLQAFCTVAILAAAPAFAQTNTETGSTGAGGMANNPTAHETMPGTMGRHTGSDTMMHGKRPMGAHAGMEDHMNHHSGMMHSGDGMHGKMSRSATADQLNEQSYQAARNGQAFTGPGSMGGSGGMMAPNGSGSMNDMPGGSMSGGGSNSK